MSVENEERVRRETMALAVKGTLDHFRTEKPSPGESMRIAVTREKPDDNSDPTQYLKFTAYSSPKNDDVIGKWERFADVAATSPGYVTIHQSEKLGTPVVESWAEAAAYAAAHGVPLIWLDDPENLFQPVLEQ